MVNVMELPDICIVPCEIALQPNTPVGIMVEVKVIVGIVVAVGLKVAVGGKGVRDGVFVNADVGVRVGVGVGVRVGDGEGDGVKVYVAVLGSNVLGGSVTTISTDTRIVRALSPIMGSPLVCERSKNGTSLGTIGKKSPLIITFRRVVLLDDGATLVSTVPSHISLQGGTVGGFVGGFVPAVPGPSS